MLPGNPMTSMRTRSKSLLGQAAAWLAAYAFVLHVVLAPIAGAAATGATPANAALGIVCAEHTDAVDPAAPAAPHDLDGICKFCVGCPAAALLTPQGVTTASLEATISPIRWALSEPFAADKNRLANRQARGPPALT
jgi:hypothetical protein